MRTVRERRRMKAQASALRMRRTTICDSGQAKSIEIILMSGEQAIMRYLAPSLEDALRYEEETCLSLNRNGEGLTILHEDLNFCAECRHRDRCLQG